MSDLIYETRCRIAETGRLIYAKHLSDAAGGNVSARAGDVVCMTPRFTGSRYHWDLKPEDVLVVDLDGNKLEGTGGITREAAVHFRLMREFPAGGSVIHAHPRNVMVFVMANQPIHPVLEGTVKFGMVKVCQYAPSHSEKLAEYVSAEFQGQETAILKQAAAVIAPWHGIFVLGKDLDAAFDALERIDTQAYCLLMGAALPGMSGLSHASIAEQLKKDQEPFKNR